MKNPNSELNNEVKEIEIDKIFYKLTKTKKRNLNINLKQKIEKKERHFKRLITNAFGHGTITKKPDSLIKFEKNLGPYFFGINGIFTHLIPNLRNELVQKEKKKVVALDAKIPIGELIFFNLTENDKDITLEKRKLRNLAKEEMIKSINFSQKFNYHFKKKILSLVKRKNTGIDKNNDLNEINRRRIKLSTSVSPNPHYHSVNSSNDMYLTSFNRDNSNNNLIKITLPYFKKKSTSKNSINNLSSSINTSISSFNLDKINSSNRNNVRLNNFRNKILKIHLKKENENEEQIEQYTIKKPLILDSYLNNNLENTKNEKKKRNINSFNKYNRIELNKKIEDYSFHENKLSKSLFNIINNNKIEKNKNNLQTDIEVVFENNIKEAKETKEKTVDEMLDEISKEKDETNSNQKTGLISNKEKISISKGNEYHEDIKITQKLLKKENEKFNVIRNKFKKQLDLIKKMKCKIDLDQIKLEDRIEKSKNIEKDHYIKYQISLIKQKKKAEKLDLFDIE